VLRGLVFGRAAGNKIAAVHREHVTKTV